MHEHEHEHKRGNGRDETNTLVPVLQRESGLDMARRVLLMSAEQRRVFAGTVARAGIGLCLAPLVLLFTLARRSKAAAVALTAGPVAAGGLAVLLILAPWSGEEPRHVPPPPATETPASPPELGSPAPSPASPEPAGTPTMSSEPVMAAAEPESTPEPVAEPPERDGAEPPDEPVVHEPKCVLRVKVDGPADVTVCYTRHVGSNRDASNLLRPRSAGPTVTRSSAAAAHARSFTGSAIPS